MTGVAAAAIGAAIRIAVMSWLSWKVAQEREVAVLDAIARRVLNRAELTFAEAYHAMDVLEKGRLAQCSPKHARMRIETVNVLPVKHRTRWV